KQHKDAQCVEDFRWRRYFRVAVYDDACMLAIRLEQDIKAAVTGNILANGSQGEFASTVINRLDVKYVTHSLDQTVLESCLVYGVGEVNQSTGFDMFHFLSLS